MLGHPLSSDVSQNLLMTLGSCGHSYTCREIKIKAGCLGKEILLSLLFVGGPSLIPFVCQLLKFQLFLLASGLQGVVVKAGVCSQKLPVCQVLHWTGLMPVWTPYLHI